MDYLPIVEIVPAGEFNCLGCKKLSYFSLIPASTVFSEEEFKDLCEKMGAEPTEEMKAYYLVQPDTVKCQHCGEMFQTYDGLMHEADNEEDTKD